MRFAVEAAWKKSRNEFLNIVWPMIGPQIGGDHLDYCEDPTVEGLQKDLDQGSSIDYLFRDKNGVMITFGSRVQSGFAYRNHTIRAFRTNCHRCNAPCEKHQELARLCRAKDAGGMVSSYSIQAYIDNRRKLLRVGAIRTLDLIDYIRRYEVLYTPDPTKSPLFNIQKRFHRYGVSCERTSEGQIFIYTAPWEQMIAKGVDVIIVEP